MKKTMTKEEFVEIDLKHPFSESFYNALSEAGISFDIYTDSDGQIIKPGDVCEFSQGLFNQEWEKGVFIGETFDSLYYIAYFKGQTYPLLIYNHCRKLPDEVWDPVPYGDINFGMTNENAFSFTYDTEKWAKARINNGKLEGVRKDGITKKELDKLKKAVTGE